MNKYFEEFMDDNRHKRNEKEIKEIKKEISKDQKKRRTNEKPIQDKIKDIIYTETELSYQDKTIITPDMINSMDIEDFLLRYYDYPSRFLVETTDLFMEKGKFTPPYPKQIHLLDNTSENSLTVIYKARQCYSLEGNYIDTPIGTYPLKEFIKNKTLYVDSYDSKNNKFIPSLLEDIWIEPQEQECYEYILKSGHKGIVTRDHEFYTNNGIKKLFDLTNNDKILINKQKNILSDNSIIQDIKPVGKRKVVNLSVYDTNTYSVNGVISKNCGMSTSIAGLFFHDAVFEKSPEFIFVSISQVQSLKIMKKFYHCLDTFMYPGMEMGWNRRTNTICVLKNGIEITSLSSNLKAGRGFTGSVFLDEFGEFPAGDDIKIWESLIPVITKGGLLFYVGGTPPRGKNLFYTLAMQTDEELTGLTTQELQKLNYKIDRIFIRWNDVPHIIKEAKKLRANLPKESWEREFELKFIDDSATMLFPSQFLNKYVYGDNERVDRLPIEEILNTDADIIRYPECHAVKSGNKKVETFNQETYSSHIDNTYEERNKHIYDGRYFWYDKKEYKPWIIRSAGFDLGIKHDRSVLSIVDFCNDNKYRLVGMYIWERGTPTPQQLKELNKICQYLEVDKLTIDGTGAGATLPSFIKELDNNNNPKFPYIYNIFNDPTVTQQFKQHNYYKLKKFMEDGRFLMFVDPDVKEEFSQLEVKPNGRIAAFNERKHDDIPSSVMFAISNFTSNLTSKIEVITFDINEEENKYNNYFDDDDDGIFFDDI